MVQTQMDDTIYVTSTLTWGKEDNNPWANTDRAGFELNLLATSIEP